jgi:hypothetical protein
VSSNACACVTGDLDEILQGSLGLGPLTSFQAAIGIEPDTVDGEVFPHRGETFGHFFDAGDTRRVDIVETRSETGTKGFAFKDVEELEIGFGVFDRDDVCVEGLDGPEDIVEVRLEISRWLR